VVQAIGVWLVDELLIEGDVVVLLGTPAGQAKSEARLLSGK
jgi:hypothetical protein